jgi:hypothetical protein
VTRIAARKERGDIECDVALIEGLMNDALVHREREFTRSSFGALTRRFPMHTDFSFDGIGNVPSKLRIGTEREDEQGGFYTQDVGGSIPYQINFRL